MVRIRFRRMGLKRQPTYRIVVTDQRKARNGGYIEVIGHHNPRTRPSTDVIDESRALYWLGTGAQPSDAVKQLMARTGTWDRFERMRKGETVEKLVAEAEKKQAEAAPISPRTQYPAPEGTGAKQAPVAVAEAVAEVVEEEVAEAEAVEEEAEEVAAEVVEEEVEEAAAEEVKASAAAAEVVEEEAEEAAAEEEVEAPADEVEAETDADAAEAKAEE